MSTMYNITDNTKLCVEGHDFTVRDLRDVPTMWQGDTSYYGSKRNVMLTADGKGDRQDFSTAVVCSDRDLMWIDGCLYRLIVKNLRASDGVMFITEDTYKVIMGDR